MNTADIAARALVHVRIQVQRLLSELELRQLKHRCADDAGMYPLAYFNFVVIDEDSTTRGEGAIATLYLCPQKG